MTHTRNVQQIVPGVRRRHPRHPPRRRGARGGGERALAAAGEGLIGETCQMEKPTGHTSGGLQLVGRTGIEPVVFGLKGRRPNR
jgi:hypothetical protein